MHCFVPNGLNCRDLQKLKNGAVLTPLGLRCLRDERTGFIRPSRSMRAGGKTHFEGIAGNDAADGGSRGESHGMSLAPGDKQHVQFVFAKVWVELTHPSDFAAEPRIGFGCASAPGGAGFGCQRCRVAAGGFEGSFPAV